MCQACSEHKDHEDRVIVPTWEAEPGKLILEHRFAGAVRAVCTGKKGEQKGPWSRLLIRKGFIGDFSPPNCRHEWTLASLKAGGVHSREEDKEPELEDTNCLSGL